MSTEHVVMFSGGVGSWAAAKRVAEEHGTEGLTLLFADTLMEDEDLYRFLLEGAAVVLGVPDRQAFADLVSVARDLPAIEDEAQHKLRRGMLRWIREEGARVLPGLVWLCEGRDPWEVFRDEKMLSGRFDPCSRILKREIFDAWLKANRDPADTVVYVGVDWTEVHRYDRLKAHRKAEGWTYEAPLCEPPYRQKTEFLADLARYAIEPPRLYALGFSHNNCGGFCIKAGQGHFTNLLRTMPARYAYHEEKEVSFVAEFGHGYFLRERAGPLSLPVLRQRVEAGGKLDLFDIGGCGCFVDAPTGDDDTRVGT